MADSGVECSETASISFSEFPDDVQLSVLSFLSPSDLSSFSCTSKFFVSLFCAESDLWYALCDRRWGSKTQIGKWGDGQVNFKLLYKVLDEYENLIGFWRRIGGSGGTSNSDTDSSPLVYFDWGSSFVTGSRVSPSKKRGHNVVRVPFVWISLSPEGEAISYLDPNCGIESIDDRYCTEKDLVPVSVSFMGKGHVFVEESRQLDIGSGSNSGSSSNSSNSSSPDTRKSGNGWLRSGSSLNFGAEELNGVEFENLIGSPPDRLMSEMYQHLANKTSPTAGMERAWRRQRRRGRERRGWRRWDPEHMVKIVDCSPTPCRPLQGLWKGICDDMSLDFYLVTYDDIGGIACRRVGDSSKPFSGGLPVFWTSDATFIESPFCSVEERLYSTRSHLKPVAETATPNYELLHSRDEKVVSRVMYINSNHNMVIPDLAETSASPRPVEGRIWQYTDGTFGFGFLRNNFIVDLNHIAEDVHPLGVN